MSDKNTTKVKLLPSLRPRDADREGTTSLFPLSRKIYNVLIAIAAACVSAYLLLPGIPHLEKGETAAADFAAPYSFYGEYQGSDQTPISYRINKGELIVESGRRVTERSARILEELARREGIGSKPHAFTGLFALVLIFFYLFYRDIKRYRPALLIDTKKLLLLAILLLMTIITAYAGKSIFAHLASKFNWDMATVGFALPVAAGAMLTSLLLDFHLALGLAFAASILLGFVFQGHPFIPVYFFLGSVIAALRVVRCKKRTAVLKAGAVTALVNILAIICIDLYRGMLLTRGMEDVFAGITAAALTTMIVSVTLPFFESLFDITTDIKLLELMDPNHPLLKELVFKSPGTYHHSILIGNLAEAAAETIGENPILARVGAYYHDIGKIQKPEYFIENQRPAENPHDKLTPSMSSLIIASHVKEGVELARAHRVPSSIIDIIQQHHGTSLIAYFYQKAREAQPAAVVPEEDYRYHGPRPRTKVAAIVMLADAVEAASRALEDPTPQRIQSVTTDVITRIFLDDQLIMCDLTLRELREISKSFTLVLTGIFHHRIDYPGMEFSGEKRRSEHPDKKQPAEKKPGNGGYKEEDRAPAPNGTPA